MDLSAMQAALLSAGLDGWLFYDFRGSDPLAARILKIPPGRHHTRRWFYFVPAVGEPAQLVHAIEPGALAGLPGRRLLYRRWQELADRLADLLAGARTVAMQYSPMNAIPYVGRVDAGALELVRAAGPEIVTSADLVQQFEATLDETQWQTHVAAMERLHRIVAETFAEIARRLRAGVRVTEFETQRFVLDAYERHGLVTDHPPIVAVDAHGADPHFEPQPAGDLEIRPDCLVMLDIWAKLNQPGAIIADITWMGCTGPEPTGEQRRVFEVVRSARDAAVSAIRSAYAAGAPIRGCDADDAARAVVESAGFGPNFLHRTGHSIHEATHGNGANLDNLETRDERRLIPRTLFSVEPGVYLEGKFGVRSEIDVFIPDANTVLVSGPAQEAILRIL